MLPIPHDRVYRPNRIETFALKTRDPKQRSFHPVLIVLALSLLLWGLIATFVMWLFGV